MSGEVWRSAEGDARDKLHHVSVEDTIPSFGGATEGNAYYTGPYKSAGRAELASQALQRRVTQRGASDRNFTNPIYRSAR